MKKPTLFVTSYQRNLPHLKLFELDVLEEGGRLKAFRANDYAPRRPHRPQALREMLFAYAEALKGKAFQVEVRWLPRLAR